MKVDIQKIKNGLLHFKRVVTTSSIPQNRVQRQPSRVMSMENPLGNPGIPSGRSNANQPAQNRGANGAMPAPQNPIAKAPQQPGPFPPGPLGPLGPFPPGPLGPLPSGPLGPLPPGPLGPLGPFPPGPLGPLPPGPLGALPPGPPGLPGPLGPFGPGPYGVMPALPNANAARQSNAPIQSPYSAMQPLMSPYQNANAAPPPSALSGLRQALLGLGGSKMDRALNEAFSDVVESTVANNNNSSAVVSGPLAVKQDLQLYENFLAIEAIRSLVPESQEGLKNLGTGDYGLERATGWHKSAYLMELLIAYYKRYHFDLLDGVTFSQFVTTLSASNLAEIWRTPNDTYTHEFIRRFIQGVRYLSPEKAEKYNVTVRGANLYWAKWDDTMPLDTTIPAFFKRKHDTTRLNPDEIAIWILSKEDRLYTHPAKLHRFHHSSFTSGDLIRCGGDWEVKDGKLIWISAKSGHYMPGFEHLQNAVKIFANKFGINANAFKVKVFGLEHGKKTEVLLPASQMLYDMEKVRNDYLLY